MKFDITQADYTNLRSVIPELAPAPKLVDAGFLGTIGAKGKEYEWNNSNWKDQWGVFHASPDFKVAETLKAVWIFGQGIQTDPLTNVEFERIKGYGKQNIRDIFFSMDITSRVTGDAYAEIVKDDKGNWLNLVEKPGSNVWIITDLKGMLKRYEVRIGEKITKIDPENMFHVSHMQLAGECHGTADTDALLSTILADFENFENLRKIMRHQAFPFIMWLLKTDNPTKIADFKQKLAECRKWKEDLVIPDDDDAIKFQEVQTNPNALVGVYQDIVRNRLFRTVMMPQIVPGAGGMSTMSESKVIAKLHEQIIAHEQKTWEERIYKQLFRQVTFNAPVSIEAAPMPGLAQTASKNANQELGFQPGETMINAGERA